MRENDLQPTAKGGVSPTRPTCDDDGAVLPFVARNLAVDVPRASSGSATSPTSRSQQGSVYLSVILDARSRRIIGHALARDLEAGTASPPSNGAIALRRPPPGCVFHSDRGVQYASQAHRALLAAHGLGGLSLVADTTSRRAA